LAAPTYATDLTTIVDFDGTPSSPSVAEPGSTWLAGRSPATDTDFPIQSTTHASLTMNTTGKAGILCTNGTTGTWTSGNYLFGWIIWLAPGAIAAEASGGLVMLTGSGISDFKVFYVGGNVSGKYPYGGWQNFAVDPTMTEDETIGTPTAYNVVGAGANVSTSVSKGNPLGFDVFRYGRGTLRVGAGDGTTPATFTGMAAANDATTARWGLFEANPGVYKFKGVMLLGYTACTFVDQNKSIVIDYTKYCQSDFNQINIQNASSNISWTNISVTSLSTVSLGSFTVTDNPTVLLDSCTFTDMGAFTFGSNTSTPDSTFRRCGQITAPGTDMTGSLVTGYVGTTDTSAVVWNVATDPNGYLDGMTFVMGTTATHAIEFGLSSPTTMTLTDCVFTGYGADSSTSAALHIKRTAGTVTINYTGVVPTYKSAGATVVLVSSKEATFTPLENGSAFTITRNSDNAVLEDVSSVTGGEVVYSYDGALDGTATTVHIIIAGKEPIDFPWTVAEGTVPVSQVTDRIYSNP
jgi:hypothetical protein